jgi:putative transposase
MISWIGRNRRMSRDYERKVQACETLIELVMFRLIPRPPARQV